MPSTYFPQLISFVVAVIGLLCAVIGFLGARYTKHVDNCITTLFDKIDTETHAREVRWKQLHDNCSKCIEALGYIKGRLEGTEIKQG